VLQPRECAHPDAFPLSKLIYCLGFIIFFGYYICLVVIEYLTARSSMPSLVAALGYSHFALFGFPLVSGIIICLLYRPLRVVFSPVQSKTGGRSTWVSRLLYGIVGGLLVFAISIPFLLREDTGGEFVAEAISHASSLNGLAVLLLLIVALPVVMEVTFRGIVFRTLVVHADVPSAIVASSLLFAFIWPTFSRPVGIVLGAFSALLYLRTNSLLSSILANALLSLCGGAFFLYRALARH